MLNNNSFLALFVFMTSCFVSDSSKLHSVFSHFHLISKKSFSLYANPNCIYFFETEQTVPTTLQGKNIVKGKETEELKQRKRKSHLHSGLRKIRNKQN